MLADNMSCMLPNSEFIIYLKDPTPTYMRQYLILKVIKPKVRERIQE